MRIRSPLFVPANRPDMLRKAVGYETDHVVVDLEDSVPVGEKENAREHATELIPRMGSSRPGIMARINAISTGLAVEDVEAVVSGRLRTITVGKIRAPEEIQEYERLIAWAESRKRVPPGQVKLLPWLETAAGVQHAFAIATASPRIVAVAFGAEDYCNDMEIPRTAGGEEIRHPRSRVALAAKAAGVIPLDTPYMNFRDAEGLRADIQRAMLLGFKGKFAIHPAQLESIRKSFRPDPAAITHAQRVLQAWEEAEARGAGAVGLDGEVIDVPIVERARRVMREAHELGLIQGDDPDPVS